MKPRDTLTYWENQRPDRDPHPESGSLFFWDPLTGLWNRHVFESRLSEELLRVRRHTHKALSIVSADVVGMTAFNEVHGREEGDLHLKGVACMLQAAVGEADMVARLGGDEFGLLLTKTDTRKAVQVLRRIRRLADRADARWGFRPIAIKLGSATTLDGSVSSRDLINCAQVAQECDELLEAA